MIDNETIDKAAELLLAAAPGSTVILFGSYARGDATEASDLDFMVVEPTVSAPIAEAVRLRRALRSLPAAVDLVVLSRDRSEYWRDTPKTLPYRALKEGRPYEQVA